MSDGGGLVQILEGNTFVVSDDRGDIEASLTDPTGLFSFDTRFLSRWVLTVDGERLNALSTDDLSYFESRFFLVPGTGKTFGEMPPEEKRKYSHRAAAARALLQSGALQKLGR